LTSSGSSVSETDVARVKIIGLNEKFEVLLEIKFVKSDYIPVLYNGFDYIESLYKIVRKEADEDTNG